MKRYLILAASVIAIVSLSGFAVDRYNNRPRVAPVPTTAQAVAAQKSADAAVLAKQEAASATVQAQLTGMTTARNAVCVQLHSLKQTNASCN